MKTIYKYPLEITDRQIIELPFGSEILSVANQGGTVCLWAMISTRPDKVPHVIRIYGTGHPVNETNLKFIGTVLSGDLRAVLTHGGSLVWHVFEDMDS